MDADKIKEGVRLILEGIGEDPEREGLVDTPDRIARMCEEIFAGLYTSPDPLLQCTFDGTAYGREMIVEKDITFYSVCEHHLLPFYGTAHVAYIPDGRVVGISKLARVVDLLAKRPRLQEGLTADIADALMRCLKPKGVIVMLTAEHTCMTMRGIKKPGTKTVTLAKRGICSGEPSLQEEFFRLIG
ncbi:MAG: GTP cyclohydrolase I FolE [Lachnospiraceae bacterium]|nr:GTP cyclohydrolase I FolE [Lachnospiraceae bacterium]